MKSLNLAAILSVTIIIFLTVFPDYGQATDSLYVSGNGDVFISGLSATRYITNDTSEVQTDSILLPTTSSSNTSAHIAGISE